MGSTLSRRGLFGGAAALAAGGLLAQGTPVRAATRVRQADRPPAQLPRRDEFVVRGAYVLTMDPALGELPRGDIHVRDGAIVAVGADLAAPGATVIDGRDRIALPGFVDTHWHLWNSSLRALVINDDPELGYFPVTLRLGPIATPEDAYRAVRLGVAEALASGITTVHDWAHNIRTPEYADAELRALRDVGIRARFAYGWGQDDPIDQPMNAADLARVQREWIAGASDSLLTLGMASRAPVPNPRGNLPLSVLHQDWDATRNLGLPITMHTTGPPGVVTILENERLLGPDVQLVHPMSTTEVERAVLAQHGTTFSTSPLTEARLVQSQRGDIQLAELLAAGILTSLSIDTTASTVNADFFNNMRILLSAHNHRLGDTVRIEPRRLLELATIDGARDLGIADRTGSLTPSKRADLILVRTTDINLAPVGDPAHALVWAAQPSNIDLVVVDGRILRRGGQFTALDVEAVIGEAAESVAGLRARAGWP